MQFSKNFLDLAVSRHCGWPKVSPPLQRGCWHLLAPVPLSSVGLCPWKGRRGHGPRKLCCLLGLLAHLPLQSSLCCSLMAYAPICSWVLLIFWLVLSWNGNIRAHTVHCSTWEHNFHVFLCSLDCKPTGLFPEATKPVTLWQLCFFHVPERLCKSYFPGIFSYFCGFGLELHKMLITQALPCTICLLLGTVEGTMKLYKFCKISKQKYLLYQSSKESKNSLLLRTECHVIVNTLSKNTVMLNNYNYLQDFVEFKYPECPVLRSNEHIVLWK